MRLTYQQIVVLAALDGLGPVAVEDLTDTAPNPFRTLRGLAGRGLAVPGPQGWLLTDQGRAALSELRDVIGRKH